MVEAATTPAASPVIRRFVPQTPAPDHTWIEGHDERAMAERPAFILLVEDDPDISVITVMALHLDPTITVTPTRNGADALHHLRDRPKPDLILTDYNLPDMDGVALVSAIKANMDDAPPIAFFTASVRSCDVARYAAAGAVGTIAKPFDPIGLAAQVRTLLLPTFRSSDRSIQIP